MRNNLQTRSAQEALRRVLSRSFTVRDLADLLIQVDISTPAKTCEEIMENHQCTVLGVTSKGELLGWVDKAELNTAQTCAKVMHKFSERPIISDSASFKDAIVALGEAEPVFVTVLGEVAAAITKNDLQESPMRMWLFGLITLIELLMTRMIERQMSDGSWQQYVSEGRLNKAKELQGERERRGDKVDLLECLQLADKGGILVKYPPSRAIMHFESKRKADDFLDKMENLRNYLAHSQRLPVDDLSVVVALAQSLENMLEALDKPILPIPERKTENS